jgi:hypothetical protein
MVIKLMLAQFEGGGTPRCPLSPYRPGNLIAGHFRLATPEFEKRINFIDPNWSINSLGQKKK